MDIKIAYSPCPNDTFAFHAMVNHLIDTKGFDFEPVLMDVQTLNESAQKGEYDICKLSYHAFFTLCDKYVMLRSGSALGYDNGPIVVVKGGDDQRQIDKKGLSSATVAIPGRLTTAALLLKMAYPQIGDLKEYLFSDITSAVISGRVDAGVLIHEGRFVYDQMGLECLMDLGKYWQKSSSLPLPLGGIAIKRSFKDKKIIDDILSESIKFAINNPSLSSDYVASNAKELSRDIQMKHINTFVNKDSVNISQKGIEAVEALYSNYLGINGYDKILKDLFI